MSTANGIRYARFTTSSESGEVNQPVERGIIDPWVSETQTINPAKSPRLVPNGIQKKRERNDTKIFSTAQ